MAKTKWNERTKVSQGSRSRMSEPHPNRDRIGDRIVLLYDARLFLQHGGPRLDEVGRLWGTQGDAAWERLRVAANERTNERKSIVVDRTSDRALRPYLTNPVARDRGERREAGETTSARDRLRGGAGNRTLPPVNAGSIWTSFPSLSCARRSNTDSIDATVTKMAAVE
jgi:hypothetical protein